MAYLTSATKPPLFEDVAYWERSKDPSHPDAFKHVLMPLQLLMAFGLFRVSRKRKDGWMGIDSSENPVCFIPDDTMITGLVPDHLTVLGTHGHHCAFRVPLDLELLARHVHSERA